ncbi:MAG: aspartate 1-decarboxylase [Desulfomonile tiedjei]|nr:aspartate 1-decarboxylase [Desulfomonile tiedjei]
MQRTMLKSKIHRARVTGACVDYEGSISIDSRLLEAADLLEYEQVHIYNVSNGERFTTYVINGEPDSGVICLNGAAARKVSVGDLVIICSYVAMEDSECKGHHSRNIFVDQNNRITKKG